MPEPDYTLEIHSGLELAADEVARWTRLSDRALDANPFQQPEFLFAKVRQLDPDPQQVRLLVLRERRTGEWAMAGLFRALEPSLKRPLPRLRA